MQKSDLSEGEDALVTGIKENAEILKSSAPTLSTLKKLKAEIAIAEDFEVPSEKLQDAKIMIKEAEEEIDSVRRLKIYFRILSQPSFFCVEPVTRYFIAINKCK